MRCSILIGGKAGEGPNILANIMAKSFVSNGYYVFSSRDYQSIIRGGHNFNVVTFSDKPVYSNDTHIDVLVCLDEKTEKIHKKELNGKGIILKNSKSNTYYAGMLFKIFGLDLNFLEKELKRLGNYDENLKYARQGYNEGKNAFNLKFKKGKFDIMNGSVGISDGAIKSGIDVYFAYPMTPSTGVLTELAMKQEKANIFVFELENEISVINTAIGAAITGAKAMVGTSGGGFDLMSEALSMTGVAEIPLVIYLGQRPGPGTGAATYNAQGDLNTARHAGHGEFPRVVVAPRDPVECEELVSQAFYFSQKLKIPCIVLGDKHLADSYYTLIRKPRITKSAKSTRLKKYSSYEHDADGIAVDSANIIKKNVEARNKKRQKIEKESLKFERFKLYGKKNSRNVIVSWGSTKGAILDSIEGLDACFLQLLYMDPFPKNIAIKLKGKNVILVENNATGLLGELIAEKTGIILNNKILRYDGRPFLCEELRKEIRRKLR